MVLAVNTAAGIALIIMAGPGLAARALWLERKTRRRLKEIEAAHAGLVVSQGDYKQLAEFNGSIFENAPLSMIATDHEGIITAMNAAAERLTH